MEMLKNIARWFKSEKIVSARIVRKKYMRRVGGLFSPEFTEYKNRRIEEFREAYSFVCDNILNPSRCNLTKGYITNWCSNRNNWRFKFGINDERLSNQTKLRKEIESYFKPSLEGIKDINVMGVCKATINVYLSEGKYKVKIKQRIDTHKERFTYLTPVLYTKEPCNYETKSTTLYLEGVVIL